jgi:hypothetical protein
MSITDGGMALESAAQEFLDARIDEREPPAAPERSTGWETAFLNAIRRFREGQRGREAERAAKRPGERLHYRDLDDADWTTRDGLPITTTARTIVDEVADGSDPEQIRKAIAQALARGLATPEALRTIARRPDYTGRRFALPRLSGKLDCVHA